MNEYTIYKNDCPIRLGLDRIADKWTVLIVSSLIQDTKRFCELRRDIEGISQKMLTQTLRSMERDGLVTRKVYPVIPPKVEYSLTELGKSLIDIRDWSKNNTENILSARKEYDARLNEELDES